MGFLGIVRAIYFALLGLSPFEIGVLLSIATFVSAIHHLTRARLIRDTHIWVRNKTDMTGHILKGEDANAFT
jgi:hypothetical protein